MPRSVFWVRAMERALAGTAEVQRATSSASETVVVDDPVIQRTPKPIRTSARTPSPLAARQQALNKSKGM